MTEEEILALLASFKAEVMDGVNKANQGVAAATSKELKRALEGLQKPPEQPEETPEGNGQRLTVKALQGELEALKGSLAEKEQAQMEALRNSAVAQAVASRDLVAPSAALKLFSLNHPNLKQEGDQWFSDGETPKSLNALLDEFLSSADGQIFVKPKAAPGAGSKTSKHPVTPPTTSATQSPFAGAAASLAQQV